MKTYKVYLNDKLIGTSNLEKADAPMGLAYGVLEFNNPKFNYKYIKSYCIDNQIQLVSDDSENNLLSARNSLPIL